MIHAEGPEVTSLLLRHPTQYGRVAMYWAVAAAAAPDVEIQKADDALTFSDERPQYPLPITETFAEEQFVERQLAS